jgi:hypothetical protein
MRSLSSRSYRMSWLFPGLLALTVVLSLVAPFTRASAQETRSVTGLFGITPRAPYSFVAAEFMSLSEIEAALPLLAARRVGLVLSWPSTAIGDERYYELVRRANAQGVAVRPWLLLPVESGYWPNSTNAREYDQAARRLIDGWIAAGLRPDTFLVDMEMPISRVDGYARVLQSLDLDQAVAYLRQGINRVQYADATRVYRALVDYAHSRGFRVELSTISQVLDDYLDGDDGLRQAFNIPVSGIDWDVYGIQAYRTLNQLVIGSVAGPTTSYYVYDYASRARALFGSKASIALGLIDTGEITPGAPVYFDGRELKEDLEAARAAGLSREQLGVYNLRGILRRTPSEQWFPSLGLISLRPLPDLATLLTRSSTALIDARL